jgi:hypothetical protein
MKLEKKGTCGIIKERFSPKTVYNRRGGIIDDDLSLLLLLLSVFFIPPQSQS